jgi:hypothetical protein
MSVATKYNWEHRDDERIPDTEPAPPPSKE